MIGTMVQPTRMVAPPVARSRMVGLPSCPMTLSGGSRALVGQSVVPLHGRSGNFQPQFQTGEPAGLKEIAAPSVAPGVVQLSLLDYQKLVRDAAAGKKEDVRSRLGERSGGYRNNSDEFRQMGDRCRCGEDHGKEPCKVPYMR